MSRLYTVLVVQESAPVFRLGLVSVQAFQSERVCFQELVLPLASVLLPVSE